MARPQIVKMLGLGEKIRKNRKRMGISQKEMADRLGIPYSTYSNYENSNRTPDSDMLEKMCEVFQITMYELIGSAVYPVDDPMMKKINVSKLSEAIEVTVERASRENRLKEAYSRLNDEGQIKALERVEELAEIPKYRRPEPPDN